MMMIEKRHTRFDNICYRDVLRVCHEAQCGKNHKSGENGGETVDCGHENGISEIQAIIFLILTFRQSEPN